MHDKNVKKKKTFNRIAAVLHGALNVRVFPRLPSPPAGHREAGGRAEPGAGQVADDSGEGPHQHPGGPGSGGERESAPSRPRFRSAEPS